MNGPLAIYAASVVALCLGPLIHGWVWDKPRISIGLDAFVVLTVLALVFGEIAPMAFEGAGYAGLATFVMGLSAPFIADRVFGLPRTHRWAHWVVAGGVLLHAFADGIALSSLPSLGEKGFGLAIALVVHRIPVGLGIWTLAPTAKSGTRPMVAVQRRRNAILLLVGVAVFTAIGQLWGKPALDYVGVQAEVFSAFAAGMLLHIVVHGPPRQEPTKRERGLRDVVVTLVAFGGAILLWEALHHTSVGHGEHVHHVEPGWVLWFVPAALLAGLWPPAARASDRGEKLTRWLELGGLGVLVCSVLLGFVWGIALALLGWVLLHRPWESFSTSLSEWLPRPRILRDLALSGWIAGWIIVLEHHGRFGGMEEQAGLALVGLSTLVIFVMRPSIYLMALPLLLSLRVAPAWLVFALLADAILRAWHREGIAPWWRWLAAGIGGGLGVLVAPGVEGWAQGMGALKGVELQLGLVFAGILFLWLGAKVGIRHSLAGGSYHQH